MNDEHSPVTDPSTTTARDSAPASGPRSAPSVGQSISVADSRWNFGGSVADTFEDHIGKSVPFYRRGHEVIAQLSDFFLYNGATMYELGCSTGALTKKIAERNKDRHVTMVGIEVEQSMVDAAERNTADLRGVDIRQGDVTEAEFEPADLILSYYTIQFIRPAKRQALMDKIYASLKWGGAFIMFEKVRAPDARFQDMMVQLYTDFKLDQGFDEHEVVHKTRSLKGVLEPFSTQGNTDMMARAGFKDQMTVFKHLCFEGFLAIK